MSDEDRDRRTSTTARTGEEAGRRTTVALAATGHERVTVTFRRLENAEDTSRVPFAGSPTIVVDGADLFPAAARITDLACRVYPTPEGLAGLPPSVKSFTRSTDAVSSRQTCSGSGEAPTSSSAAQTPAPQETPWTDDPASAVVPLHGYKLATNADDNRCRHALLALQPPVGTRHRDLHHGRSGLLNPLSRR